MAMNEQLQKFIPEDNDDNVLYRSIDLSFGIVIVVLNIIEITIICRLRNKKIYEVLLLSLSVSDLLFGLSNSVKCIIFLSDHKKYESLEITYFYFIATSILHLTWISLDHVWAVHAPLKHNINVTKKRTVTLIIATWLFTTMAASSMFIYDEIEESLGNATENVNVTKSTTDKLRKYKLIVQQACSIIILIADIVFIISYSFIIYTLNKRSTVRKIISATARASQVRIAVNCTFVCSVFVLFTFPYATAFLITGSARGWANSLLVSNSGLNTIVYCFRGRYLTYLKKRKQEKQRRLYNKSSTIRLSNYASTSRGPPTLTDRLTQDEPIARRKQSSTF